MEWLFRIVFGLMGVCVLIWLAEQVKNLLSPRQRCPAVVKERRQQVFPVSVGFKRRPYPAPDHLFPAPAAEDADL